MINRKLEEKDCGEGPSLEIIFEDDVHMKEIQEKIIVNNSIIIVLHDIEHKLNGGRRQLCMFISHTHPTNNIPTPLLLFRKWYHTY